jgi:hypothetical protein
MNGGNALRFRKNAAGGALERLALLEEQGIALSSLDEDLHDQLTAQS